MSARKEFIDAGYIPTLTAVRLSSSEALLPPPALLVMLNRLVLLGAALAIALRGREGSPPGDAGGELAMAGYNGLLLDSASFQVVVVVRDSGRYYCDRG